MRIDILTIHPELLKSPFDHSILQRAKDKKLVEIVLHDIRTYAANKHKKVDDYQFGGGAGMVMTIQPIADCIDKLKKEREYDSVIYLTPDGSTLKQQMCNQISTFKNIIILCGHYKGVDQRIRDHYITQEISVGDFVLTGGELAAAILCDSVIRLIPGVISDETSALTDSFQDNLLAPPVYTRPANFNGWEVPEILLSGHLKNIEQWREDQAIERTKNRRPDLL
ncbi:tRNA (guanosine(37)-N1)-methyltransferase TrmD [Flavobacteriales bacterium]|nr:tRNA (guanosine(37)-N1)-methyltransferase TrmD [Flavobacteriales bacterium]